MAGAVAAAHAVGQGYAVGFHPNGMPYLYARLLGYGDGADGAGGAHLGAACALGAAIAALIRHLGLHEGHQVARGAQYLVGAIGDAQLASGAMLGQMRGAERARRSDGGSPFGYLFLFDSSQTAIDLHLLCFQQGTSGQYAGEGQELPAGVVPLCLGSGSFRFGRLFVFRQSGAGHVVNGVLGATIETIHAHYAAAVVDSMIFGIDARGFAVAGTRLATVAFGRVDGGAEEREPRQQPQRGAHRADGVAVGASVAPGQYDDDYQGDRGYDERGEALEPDLGRVEGIAVHALGHEGKQVVAPPVYRGKEVGGYAAVGAVWSDEGGPGG